MEFAIRQKRLVQGTPPSWLKVKTAMANTGRNDPCPCGSGKKYKRCCLDKDEAAEREELAARVTPALDPPWQRSPEILAEMREALGAISVDDDEDELTAASNAAVDLVNAGKLDEAEKAARDLLERFPKCTMATIASVWSTKQEEIRSRRPTTIARSSSLFESMPRITTQRLRPSSTSSLPSSIPQPQPDCAPQPLTLADGHGLISRTNRAQFLRPVTHFG